MISTPFTRRGVVGQLALAATGFALAGKAVAAIPDAATARQRAVAALIRTAFPHDRLSAAYYDAIARTYIAERAAAPADLTALDRGIALLDGSHIAPFADLPPAIQKGLVEQIDQLPFFKTLLWRVAELMYRDPVVWKIVGYQGSSIEYGGYKQRGFDDIDWLPKTGPSA
jgi:hypothetical protein